MKNNIPETTNKRVVIVGAGFGGLKLAHKLAGSNYQVVLIDKNNYHQFQPLFYQVATAGLEPSAISFPLRKVFQNKKNIFIRIAEVQSVNIPENYIQTNIDKIKYDYLVLATGAETNFYNNKKIMQTAIPMKSVSEALGIRNKIIENYEEALYTEDKEEQLALMNIVVVGGGPTGVEVSGTLAEMRKHILPKDYPELDFAKMQVSLVEATPKVLGTMSQQASDKATEYLKKLDVVIHTNTSVKDYDGRRVILSNGTVLNTKTLIWAAGVIGFKLPGLPGEIFIQNNRIKVDQFNKVAGTNNVFAIGDIACMIEEKYPKGHPQLAQPAIQQAKLLAENLISIQNNKEQTPFHYKNPGTMATVGKNLAVVDLPHFKFHGFFAWLAWMLVHLMSIVGVKNRILIFINWAWNYITFDQSLRLIIRPKSKPSVVTTTKEPELIS